MVLIGGMVSLASLLTDKRIEFYQPTRNLLMKPIPFLDKLNSFAQNLCDIAASQHQRMEIEVSRVGSVNILDFGVNRIGTFNGGLLLSRICLADLAEIKLIPSVNSEVGLTGVQVVTDWPLQSCIASQYAGWPFATDNYYAMCSGPARLVRGSEELLAEYELSVRSDHPVAIFESDTVPGEDEVEQFLTQLSGSGAATICIASTHSLPGTIQVVARSVETAMHKLHELKIDLHGVKRAIGTAPMSPLGKNSFQSLGWTNDSILYGTHVDLWVDFDRTICERLTEALPSSASDDFGRPFADIFEQYDHDFYKIDRMLFSPASIALHNIRDGKVYRGGEIRADILNQSFGHSD